MNITTIWPQTRAGGYIYVKRITCFFYFLRLLNLIFTFSHFPQKQKLDRVMIVLFYDVPNYLYRTILLPFSIKVVYKTQKLHIWWIMFCNSTVLLTWVLSSVIILHYIAWFPCANLLLFRLAHWSIQMIAVPAIEYFC